MSATQAEPNVALVTCGGWYLPQTARAFAERGALAGLWMTDKDRGGLPPGKFHRCWPFHLAMKPFYHLTPQIWSERAFHSLFPIWKKWIATQRFPGSNVVQALMGYASEPFAVAENTGALKVVDCPNSHPTTYYGYWQRECDLWCPGEKVPIPRWMLARMNRELEMADVILCPSLFVRDSMLNNGIPEAKCFVNPFGVDTDVFKPRITQPVAPRFVAIGTICLRKGFQYLFRAFQIVKKKLPDAELVVAGNYKSDFRRERPKWEGTFTHHPHLSHAELAALLQSCTAFVFPSAEEGFARVISEAMGAGLPIVASFESGATTLVEDGVEGLIVRGRDPEHIAEAMIRVATDAALNQRMGSAAFARCGLKNSWQDYGDRLLSEYVSRLKTKLS